MSKPPFQLDTSDIARVTRACVLHPDRTNSPVREIAAAERVSRRAMSGRLTMIV